MAYVSGKDGAHTQNLSVQQIEPLNVCQAKTYYFCSIVKLIYINPDREIKTPAFH